MAVNIDSTALTKHDERADFTSTHLPWVRSFHALHAHALRPGSCVPLLGHPLAMSSERPHALASRLVHSNGRPTHVGCIHACPHVSRERWRAPGPWLVYELAVVCLVWCHLEGGAHLEDKNLLFKIQTQIKCLLALIDDCAICDCETTSLQSLRKEKAYKADRALFSLFLPARIDSCPCSGFLGVQRPPLWQWPLL